MNNKCKLGNEMMIGDVVKLNCKKEGLVNGMIFKVEKIQNGLINDKFKREQLDYAYARTTASCQGINN